MYVLEDLIIFFLKSKHGLMTNETHTRIDVFFYLIRIPSHNCRCTKLSFNNVSILDAEHITYTCTDIYFVHKYIVYGCFIYF